MRIEKLDGLRGVFSLMVVVFHYPEEFLPIWFSEFFMIRQSFVFVDFFFVLSGFVISYNYNTLSSSADFWKYLRNRFTRLYPLLFYSCSLVFIYNILIKLLIQPIFPGYFANNQFTFEEHILPFFDSILFMNSTPILGSTSGVNHPSWSISSEMISYLVFGLVAIAIHKKFKKYILASIILISAVLLFYLGNFFLTGDYGFLRGLVCFNLGYFVWKLYKKDFVVNSSFEYVLPILMIVIFYYLSILGNLTTFGLLYNILAIPLFFSFAILLFTKTNGYLTRLLEKKTIQYLGKISYSIYLNHIIVFLVILNPLYKILKIQPTAINQLLIFVLVLLIIIFYSHFTYKYIEIKGNIYLKKLFK